MSLWFIVSFIKKRNDVADVAWGLGFVLMAWSALFLGATYDTKALIVTTLVTIWGIRLAWHIHSRNKGRKEDYRYEAWRKEWGTWFYPRSYVQVYLLQGFLLFLIVQPVLLISQSSSVTLGLLDVIGIAVWLFGFYFEAVGDAQLSKFIKNPDNRGKIMQSGLWAYTRHPNYFGEVTQWWGLWIVALSIPGAFWTIIGPITITFLILKVSGIPMLEKKMEENPDFIEYKKRVSVFFPLPSSRRS